MGCRGGRGSGGRTGEVNLKFARGVRRRKGPRDSGSGGKAGEVARECEGMSGKSEKTGVDFARGYGYGGVSEDVGIQLLYLILL